MLSNDFKECAIYMCSHPTEGYIADILYAGRFTINALGEQLRDSLRESQGRSVVDSNGDGYYEYQPEPSQEEP
jgi:hypothetical protein